MKRKTLFLNRGDGKIACDDSGGSGPLVIASPGIGDLRQVYRHLSPLLIEAGVRFVSMDLRGLGESSIDWADYSDVSIASDYLALVEQLNSSPAVLIGNSKTASSVVIASTEDPDKVSGIILLGPFAREVPIKWWQKALFGLMLGGPWGRSAWISYYKKNMYPGNKPDDFREYVKILADNPASIAPAILCLIEKANGS